MLETIELETGESPTGSVIWMHGLGADGNDFVPIVHELRALPVALRYVFPHAPVRPVTINGGMPMRAWYDVLELSRDGAMDTAGLRESCDGIVELVARERDRGLQPDRILLAGFSQGGAVALHTGLRYPERLAGVIGLSTYLPDTAHIAAERSAANQDVEIFLAHGRMDPVLPINLGVDSKNQLLDWGYSVEWHEYAYLPHSVALDEIRDLSVWMANRFAT